jgi:hypothetical protein
MIVDRCRVHVAARRRPQRIKWKVLNYALAPSCTCLALQVSCVRVKCYMHLSAEIPPSNLVMCRYCLGLI